MWSEDFADDIPILLSYFRSAATVLPSHERGSGVREYIRLRYLRFFVVIVAFVVNGDCSIAHLCCCFIAAAIVIAFYGNLRERLLLNLPISDDNLLWILNLHRPSFRHYSLAGWNSSPSHFGENQLNLASELLSSIVGSLKKGMFLRIAMVFSFEPGVDS